MSYAERIVADFLTDNKIKWIFEQPVSIVEENDRTRTWYPDFYLPDISIYLEVCGAERPKDYDFRKKKYKSNKIPVIFIEQYKDDAKWQHYLMVELKEIHDGRTKSLEKVQYIKKIHKSSGQKIHTTEKNFCFNCGSKLKNNPNFCSQCGTDIRR